VSGASEPPAGTHAGRRDPEGATLDGRDAERRARELLTALSVHGRRFLVTEVDVFAVAAALAQPGGSGSPRVERSDAGAAGKAKSCNRHDDCDQAAAKYRERHGRDPGVNFHCWDECCEECFGN
jgi:hypothetical protein